MAVTNLNGCCLILLVLLASCGVKSDPLPPEKPPKLGRGHPTYHKATRDFAYPTLPPLRTEEDNEEDE